MNSLMKSWFATAMAGLCLATAANAASSPGNILYIGEGGIALPDTNEEDRHWSEWTINLIDGSTGYGWLSEASVTLPHDLVFELAGVGTITAFTLDSGFTAVEREDGTHSEKPEGAPLRAFTLMASVTGPEGPYVKVLDSEAAKGQRSVFKLKTPVEARWLKLVVRSNWGKGGQTYLSEFEAIGEIKDRVNAPDVDVSGLYDHEYGTIVLRQTGNSVTGCYDDGKGRLNGVMRGRTLRLSYYEPERATLGAATFAWAHDKLYGFWYRRTDQMGSPWNAKKISGLAGADLGKCADVIDPQAKK